MNSEMKTTDSPWMQEVPAAWQVLPARYCVESRHNGNWGQTPLNEDEGIFCLRAADFDYDRLRFKPQDSFTRRLYNDFDFERIKVHPGDLLVEKSGGGDKTPVGRAILVTEPLEATFSNFLERIIVRRDRCIPDFFAYWWTAGYQSGSFIPFYNQTTGIQNLNTTELLASNVIALPTLDEQHAIVKRLNEERTKIDQAIDFLQRELDTLEQLKKSMIHEAVTKGLDRTVLMKPSGVEWIGDIPEHWEAKKLKFIASFGSGTTPDSGGYSYYDDGEIPWIQSGDLYRKPRITRTEKTSQLKRFANCPH
ncbi:restriction endonuclease S subunit [Arcanobacterium pluranimalium]|uniref:restriction endonuclease subunit S n=1 Tax=Arcanobacterium pluranimalium TaxID=108028 RepID=UPI00195BCE49|nr:restriction endonuclease subunit S [Arcanobacterium pluranimalium]MBM7824702.1 restriction endonuclease S subunit [Arcanobacterium pluranimalium]